MGGDYPIGFRAEAGLATAGAAHMLNYRWR